MIGDVGPLTFEAPLWRWQAEAPAAWYFVTLPDDVAAEVKFATLGSRTGFGSVKVEAVVGGSRWRTSLFPHRTSGSYLLPMKATVRRAEGLDTGSPVRATITLV